MAIGRVSGSDPRLIEWLKQLGVDPRMSRRVVIDIPVDGAVMIYVESFASTNIVEIQPPELLNVKIVNVE